MTRARLVSVSQLRVVVLHVAGDQPLLTVPTVDMTTVGTATIAMPDVTITGRARLEGGEAALHDT